MYIIFRKLKTKNDRVVTKDPNLLCKCNVLQEEKNTSFKSLPQDDSTYWRVFLYGGGNQEIENDVLKSMA